MALKILAYFLVQLGFRNWHLLVHFDNNGAIGAYTKGCSLNIKMNLSVRRAYEVLVKHGIALSFIYVASADNLADPVLRGIFSLERHLTYLFKLPAEFSSVLVDVW